MLASTARYNASLTAKAFKLVAAVEVRQIPAQVEAYSQALAAGTWAMKPNYEVLGECGHRLDVVREGSQVDSWQGKIQAKRRHRRRCEHCVVDPIAAAERILV